MKTWLAKFKISNALNHRHAPPMDAEACPTKSAAVRHFSQQAAALDQLLKNSPPAPPVSAAQHAAIMRAVRAIEIAPKFSWPKVLIPAAAITLVIFVAAIASLRSRYPAPATADSPLSLATAALQSGDTFAQSFPAATQPLADEMTLLHRDATNAQDFILASLP
jgi:hypothetical protein